MQKFAALTGDKSGEEEYRLFADNYKSMLIDSLWLDPSRKIENRQTWLSGLLFYDIVPPQDQLRAVNMLVEDIDDFKSIEGNQLFAISCLKSIV